MCSLVPQHRNGNGRRRGPADPDRPRQQAGRLGRHRHGDQYPLVRRQLRRRGRVQGRLQLLRPDRQRHHRAGPNRHRHHYR